MQFLLTFVVLVFSIALLLFASPVILYVVPLIVIGLVASILIDRHQSGMVKH